jgi:hypothetical protein
MLYKRAFRKEKEVATFLIKALKWNLAINLKIGNRKIEATPLFLGGKVNNAVINGSLRLLTSPP